MLQRRGLIFFSSNSLAYFSIMFLKLESEAFTLNFFVLILSNAILLMCIMFIVNSILVTGLKLDKLPGQTNEGLVAKPNLFIHLF